MKHCRPTKAGTLSSARHKALFRRAATRACRIRTSTRPSYEALTTSTSIAGDFPRYSLAPVASRTPVRLVGRQSRRCRPGSMKVEPLQKPWELGFASRHRFVIYPRVIVILNGQLLSFREARKLFLRRLDRRQPWVQVKFSPELFRR